MEQNFTQNIKKPNEIRISIIGLAGSGKTTYQAGFAYLLFNNTDKELKHGEPIGKSTRYYLNPKIMDLISGKFPEPTTSDIQLSYRLNYKGTEYLLNTLDYNGCMTSNIHNLNPETLHKIETASKPDDASELKELRAFFEKCNSHFIFIPVEELINEFENAPIDKYACIYDIISYYKKNIINRGKKLKNPIFLVVTKVDKVDLNDKNVLDKINKAVKQFEVRLKEYAKNFETVLVSSIGDNFLDSDEHKSEKAELAPKNILFPIKELLKYQDKKRRNKRNTAVLSFMLLFILAIFATGLISFFNARQKVDAFVKLGNNLAELDNNQLEIKLGEINETHKLLGWRTNFILEDTEGIKQNLLNAILSELDIRKYQEITDFTAEQPTNIAKLEELTKNYNKKSKNEFFTKKFAAQVNELLLEKQRIFDETCWQTTISSNTIEAYSDYISQCTNFGAHINEAMQKISVLKKQNVENKWHNIEEYIAESPDDFVGIVKKIQTFLRIYPHAIVNDNNPNNLLENFIKKWDEHEWAEICEFFNTKVNVIDGNLEILAQAAKKYSDYLKLFNFRTPSYKNQAEKMIALIQQITKPQKYKVSLLKATSVGKIHEAKPDLYLKIFVNRKLLLNSKDIIKDNEKNPVWNFDFEVTWKSYYQLQLQLRDSENVLVNDVLIKPYLYKSLFSAANAFGSPVFPANTGKITIDFTWFGPSLK